jgi:hypothetical protein
MRNQSKAHRVTMPKWPAWVLFGTMAACAYPAVTASAGADSARAAAQPIAQQDTLASALAR